MADNPYVPPAAEVADPPRARRVRPRAVNIALGLLILTLTFRLFRAYRGLQNVDFSPGNLPMLALLAGEYLLFGVVIYQIAQGRRWARTLLLVIAVFTFAMTCYSLGLAFRLLPEAGALMFTGTFLVFRVLPVVVTFVALHLLYFTGAEWFGRQPDQAQ